LSGVLPTDQPRWTLLFQCGRNHAFSTPPGELTDSEVRASARMENQRPEHQAYEANDSGSNTGTH
jgi:hypothetical protein